MVLMCAIESRGADNFEEPVLYALIFLLFFFNGAGPVSIDSVIYEQIKREE